MKRQFSNFDIPSKLLKAELIELATECQQTIGIIDSSNALPSTFPRDRVIASLKNATNLQYGTDEGARLQLKLFISDLTNVRAAHILRKTDADEIDRELVVDDNYVPVLRRGSEIDNSISNVIYSMTTCLSTISISKGNPEELEAPLATDYIKIPEYLRVDTSQKNLEIINNLKEISHNYEEELDVGAYQVERHIRLTEDSKNLISVSGDIVGKIGFSSFWLGKIKGFLYSYPKLIKRSGRTINSSMVIAKPIVKRIQDYMGEKVLFTCEQIEKWGKTLEQIAKNVEEDRKSNFRADNDLPALEEAFVKFIENTIQRKGVSGSAISLVSLRTSIETQFRTPSDALVQRDFGFRNLPDYLKTLRPRIYIFTTRYDSIVTIPSGHRLKLVMVRNKKILCEKAYEKTTTQSWIHASDIFNKLRQDYGENSRLAFPAIGSLVNYFKRDERLKIKYEGKGKQTKLFVLRVK